MWILMKVKGLLSRKRESVFDEGFELQDWKTFGLPKSEEVGYDWLGKLLAIVFTLIAAGFVRYFNTQSTIIQEVFLPQFILIVVAGILIVYNLLEFRICPLLICVFFGFLIILF